jgi:phospholipid/cholesterol/gamma-HCH transport system ATP-binding protein
MMNPEPTTINISPRTNSDQVIGISNLRKLFNGQEVLKDVTLQLFNGENLVVLGKSGSGKSVLIKCIVRLFEPDNGTINVLGEDVNTLNRHDLGELRKKIGFLFQSGALYDSMSVRKNLEFPLRRIRKNLSPK